MYELKNFTQKKPPIILILLVSDLPILENPITVITVRNYYKMISRLKKNRQNPYVMLHSNIAETQLLTAKAKGILLYLFSRPDNWQFFESEILKHFKDKRDSIRSGIQELIQSGYLLRYQIRHNGKFAGWEYNVFEIPRLKRKTKNQKPTLNSSNKIENYHDRLDEQKFNTEKKLESETVEYLEAVFQARELKKIQNK